MPSDGNGRNLILIAIVGGVEAYWSGIPWADPDCQIWTVPRLAGRLPRTTRAYELHPPEVANQYVYVQAVSDSGAERVTWDDLPPLPAGPLGNSIAVMLAHAAVEGRDRIGIWGAPQTGEYRAARDSMFYWIGWLIRNGATIEDHSDLVNWGERYGKKAARNR